MSIHWLDAAVLAVYFLSMACLGYYFSRKNKSTEDYFAGGRAFSGLVVGISLVGYSISSITFLAYPADGFKTAWVRYIPNLALPVAMVLAAWLFIPFFRKIRVPSAYHFLEGRFGHSIRVYVSIAFMVTQLARLSIVLYLVSLVVHQMTGLGTIYCILLAGLITAFYTVLGGIDAVIWTDVIQAVVLLGGGMLCLALVAAELPGGFGQIVEVGWADGKLAFADLIDGQLQPIPWDFALSHKTVIMLFIVGLVGWTADFSGNQNTVQRYIASKSTGEARKAVFICGLSSLPIWALFMFIGTALYVFFKVYPTAVTTEILNGTRKAEEVLPYFITEYVPPGLTGLIIAAVLAAAMSSLSASINATATVSIIDIYQRMIVRNRSDRHYLKAAWVSTSLVSVIMVCGAIGLNAAPSMTILDSTTILMSVLGGGILGIYLLGILTRWGDARAVWAGIICTAAFTIWTVLSDRGMLPAALTVPFDLYYTAIIGNLVMLVVALVAGLTVFRQRRDIAHLTMWGEDERGDLKAADA